MKHSSANDEQELTHLEIAKKSGLPCSDVTGILSGSLQKVTLDRFLRMIDRIQIGPNIRSMPALNFTLPPVSRTSP